MHITAGYMTGSGNLMTMMLHTKCMRREHVPVYDCDISELCMYEMTCRGYNGGCPPHAPSFDKLKPGSKALYIISVEFDMAAAIQYSAWQRGGITPSFSIISYANQLTMHYIRRLLCRFKDTGFYTLGAGNCRGCRPKDCNVVRGGRCIRPRKRLYSIEAVGVSCDTIHRQMYGEALPWCFWLEDYVPARMYRYAGVFVDSTDIADYDRMLFAYVKEDMSYTNELVEYEYDIVSLTIPDDCYNGGQKYNAYRIPLELINPS